MPPLLPNFILSEKEKLIDLSINLGCENASLALYIIEKRGYASSMPPRGHRSMVNDALLIILQVYN